MQWHCQRGISCRCKETEEENPNSFCPVLPGMANRILYDVCDIVECYLSPHFGHLTVKVVECPNLSQRPFYLGRSGICGDSTIANVGSLDYLLPCADPSRLYDIMDITKYTGHCQGMILGGGVGPFQCYNKPCEVSTEITFSTRGLQCNRSLIGFCSKECGSPASERASNTLISSLGQLFITEAMPGKVVEIVAHRRIGEPSIFDLIQASLYNKFSKQELPMALGCVFYLQNSGALANVLCELPQEPYHTFPCLKKYQASFNIDGPVIGVGTVLSHDPKKMGFSMASFHCWNASRLLTGHFENDVCPEKATYTVYLTPAKKLYRQDKPVHH
ncbi:hypothetical protein TSMEX_008932 [Taenia solium]|eukprot:TsM_000786900 transcript=TsM_000786900 gene=TsM_000786900